MNKNQYQVAIIGAGPAGSTCAVQLMRMGLKSVLLIESGGHDKFRIGESIPPDANAIFHQLGLYHDFTSEGHEPCYGSCSYWGSDRRGYNDFLLNRHGNGWHLDRRKFDAFLAQKAAALGAEVMTHTTFQKAESMNSGGFQLSLLTNKQAFSTINADVVVDASGSRAVFATAQKSQKNLSFPLVCLGARFKLNDALQTISKLTHLEAVESGWWYAARIPNDMLLVALYTGADLVKSKKLNQMNAWLSLLNATPNTQVLTRGLALVDEHPKGFPAPSFQLDRMTGKDWLAIGDAAATYDPITAQGITKSMLNALSAAAVIVQKLAGQVSDFDAYAQEIDQQYEQYLTMRQYFYALERRWPDSPFWKKFHEEKVLS